MARLTERARTSPYYPALSHPVLRRVLPGAAASALATVALGLITAAILAARRRPGAGLTFAYQPE